jgi:hypothetical protein
MNEIFHSARIFQRKFIRAKVINVAKMFYKIESTWFRDQSFKAFHENLMPSMSSQRKSDRSIGRLTD